MMVLCISSMDLSMLALSTFGMRYSSAFSRNHFYMSRIRGKFSMYLLLPGLRVMYLDLTANRSLCLLSFVMESAKGRTLLYLI